MTVVTLGMPSVGRPIGKQEDARARLRPDTAHLVDSFGRVAVDLRVSLTDRCNLRCSYCMPEEGLDWMASPDLLSDAEVVRLIDIAVSRLGIREVRFTGGEPLMRRGLEAIITAVAQLSPRPQISLTTNGVGLARRAADLAASGVDRLNVSLDTLQRDRFEQITRRDRLNDVLAGMAAAREAGLEPVKMNTVLLRGVNDDEAVALPRFAVANTYEPRFIEQMPLDAQHEWDRRQMVDAQDILRAQFELVVDTEERGAAQAELWLVDGGPARVGIIGSVTRPFCVTCDRTRLTADGQLRTCLFAAIETDLRVLLRGGADDEDIAACWRDAMWAKAAGHGINDPGFRQPSRSMSTIGG